MKTIPVLGLLVLAASCASETSAHFLVGDAWSVDAAGRYVVGTTTSLRLTRRTSAEYPGSLLSTHPCNGYDCTPVERFRVTSSEPSIFEVVETDAGPVGHALMPGEARLEAHHDGEVVATQIIHVAVPDRLELEPALLDRWMLGRAFDDDPTLLGTRVARASGSVLDVQVSCWSGEHQLRSSVPLRTETALSVETPSWAPGEVLRIRDSELGVAELGVTELWVEVAGLRARFEIETIAPESIDQMTLVDLPALTDTPDADTWHLATMERDGERLLGLAPIEWRVDGRPIGRGGILGCGYAAGRTNEIEARFGGGVQWLEGSCEAPVLIDAYDPD